eukprot:COSAG06_NODE_516_length_14818_cov_18.077926_4_plen_72_part_00
MIMLTTASTCRLISSPSSLLALMIDTSSVVVMYLIRSSRMRAPISFYAYGNRTSAAATARTDPERSLHAHD